MFDIMLFSYDSSKLEAMLNLLESQKTTDKKTNLNKIKKQTKEYKMKVITMNYNPITGQSFANIIEAPIVRLQKNKKQKKQKTYGKSLGSSKYNVHSRILPTYKQVVVVTTADVELNNTKIKTIQTERNFINPLIAKNFQKKLTLARKQQHRNKQLLQNVEITR